MIDFFKNIKSKYLIKGSFIRQVGTLSFGTSIAQFLPIAISPILTRVYTPEQFGISALFFSCVAICSVISTGRYELAITLPHKDKEAATLLIVTLKICLIISLLIYLPLIFLKDAIVNGFGLQKLSNLIYLIPVSVFMNGSFITFQYWHNRLGNYKEMAVNKIQNSFFSVFINLGLGIININAGLIIGNILGVIFANFFTISKLIKKQLNPLKIVNAKKELELIKKYIHHPQYIASGQLIGEIAVQIPIIIIANLYNNETLGYFALARRLVSLPLGLIGNSIGDVYREKISKKYNKNGNFHNLYKKTLFRISAFSIPFFITLYFSCPIFIDLIFGTQWSEASGIFQKIVIMGFFQFIFTAIDDGAVVTGATRYIFGWHTSRLLLIIMVILISYYFSLSFDTFLWFFISINIFLYIYEIIMEFYLSKGNTFAK